MKERRVPLLDEMLVSLGKLFAETAIRTTKLTHDGTSLRFAVGRGVDRNGHSGLEARIVVNFKGRKSPRVVVRVDTLIQTKGHSLPHEQHVNTAQGICDDTCRYEFRPKRKDASDTLITLVAKQKRIYQSFGELEEDLQTLMEWSWNMTNQWCNDWGNYARNSFPA